MDLNVIALVAGAGEERLLLDCECDFGYAQLSHRCLQWNWRQRRN